MCVMILSSAAPTSFSLANATSEARGLLSSSPLGLGGKKSAKSLANGMFAAHCSAAHGVLTALRNSSKEILPSWFWSASSKSSLISASALTRVCTRARSCMSAVLCATVAEHKPHAKTHASAVGEHAGRGRQQALPVCPSPSFCKASLSSFRSMHPELSVSQLLNCFSSASSSFLLREDEEFLEEDDDDVVDDDDVTAMDTLLSRSLCCCCFESIRTFCPRKNSSARSSRSEIS